MRNVWRRRGIVVPYKITYTGTIGAYELALSGGGTYYDRSVYLAIRQHIKQAVEENSFVWLDDNYVYHACYLHRNIVYLFDFVNKRFQWKQNSRSNNNGIISKGYALRSEIKDSYRRNIGVR